MEYKEYKLANYNIYTIKSDKFKNCHLEVIFRKKIVKEELTKDALLCDILMHSSKEYPTGRDLSIAFEELYATSIYGITSKVGSALFTNFCIDFLHPKYTEKELPKKALKLLFEMINNPNIKENSFDIDNFNIIKNNLRATILAQKENVVGYAIRRMLENLDKDSPTSYSIDGYLEDLDIITPQNLYEHYQDFIANSLCDIFLIGDLDMDKIVSTIKTLFKRPKVTKKINLFAHNKTSNKALIVKEKENFSQANLVIGCNTSALTEKEKNTILPLYNVILGSGSLENKLAKYLRSDNSLCYQTNSIYQKFDELLIIYAGIEESSYNLAVKLIKKALKEMEEGTISEEELESAKLLVISSLEMAYDNASTLINNYVFNIYDNLPPLDKRIEAVKNVTKEEVVNVSKKVKLNTIFLLSPGGEE